MITPCLTILAGPNGAGKSTIYEMVKPLGRFINADQIESALPSIVPRPTEKGRRRGVRLKPSSSSLPASGISPSRRPLRAIGRSD